MSRRQIWWIALGAGAVLLRILLGMQPQLIEQLYSRGIFLGIRWLIDYVLAWFPLPLIYLFLSALLIVVIVNVWKWSRTSMNWRKRLISGVGGVLAFIGGAIFFFLFLWGFNYGRVPVEDQLGLEPKPLSLDDLKEELKLETEYIIELRSQIPHITDSAITADFLPENLERQVRRNLEKGMSCPPLLLPPRPPFPGRISPL
ncbi:MAG: DUF3810 family protein [Saprospiraceae bacterium]